MFEPSKGDPLNDVPASHSDNEFEDDMRSNTDIDFFKDLKVEMDSDEMHLVSFKVETEMKPPQTFSWENDPPDYPEYVDLGLAGTVKMEFDDPFIEVSGMLECEDPLNSDIKAEESVPPEAKFPDENLQREDQITNEQPSGFKGPTKKALSQGPTPCKVHYVDRTTSKCKKCGNIILNKADLIEDYNLKEKAFVCEICGEYVLESHLSEHQERHPNTYFKCEFCSEKFINNDDLTLHQNEHQIGEREEDFSFQCHACGKKFETRSKLNSHIHIAHKKELILPSCKICSMQFVSVRSYNDHLSRKHKDQYLKNNRKKQCEFCLYKCESSNAMNNHLMYQHGSYVQCDVCLKRCISQRSLTVHMKNHRGCIICSKKFPAGKIKLKCNKCEKM